MTSLSVEIAQMFGTGTTDINALISNTFGACIGFCIYRLLTRALPESRLSSIRTEGSGSYHELLLLWTGTLVIVLTVQIQIFHVFFS